MNNKELKANAIVGVAPLGDPHFEEHTQTSPTAYTNSKSKIKTLTSDNKGITLIALVITIIVMLILVAVTVTVALNGGLFTTAKQATTDTQYHADREMLLSAVIGAIGSNAEVDFTELDKNLPEGFTKAEDGGYTSKAGNTFYVDKNGNITDEPLKTAAELFDERAEKIETVKSKEDTDFTTDGNLHIGDFINYDAGTWTQDEINAIKVGLKDENGNGTVSPNGVRELPRKEFQFGGFDAHHSDDDPEGCCRNGNAVTYYESYNYYKDGDNNPITGWRLFDIDKEEGTITLISAGCPEDFYIVDSGYIGEYILSGNVSDKASSLDLENSYTKRRWNNYVNTTQHATSANALTKGNLDDWYKKYMEASSADTYDSSTFKKIYRTRYENLIDNYSSFWLATEVDYTCLCCVDPVARSEDGFTEDTNGVRILVTLSSDVQLSKRGEKTVKNIEGDENRSEKPYTYNVWSIQ